MPVPRVPRGGARRERALRIPEGVVPPRLDYVAVLVGDDARRAEVIGREVAHLVGVYDAIVLLP